jgi:hypothetical protein
MSQTAIVEAALRQLGLTYETFAEMSPEALRKYWREMIKQADGRKTRARSTRLTTC